MLGNPVDRADDILDRRHLHQRIVRGGVRGGRRVLRARRVGSRLVRGSGRRVCLLLRGLRGRCGLRGAGLRVGCARRGLPRAGSRLPRRRLRVLRRRGRLARGGLGVVCGSLSVRRCGRRSRCATLRGSRRLRGCVGIFLSGLSGLRCARRVNSGLRCVCFGLLRGCLGLRRVRDCGLRGAFSLRCIGFRLRRVGLRARRCHTCRVCRFASSIGAVDCHERLRIVCGRCCDVREYDDSVVHDMRENAVAMMHADKACARREFFAAIELDCRCSMLIERNCAVLVARCRLRLLFRRERRPEVGYAEFSHR